MSNSKAHKDFLATYDRGYKMIRRSIDLLKALGELEDDPSCEDYNRSEFITEAGRSGVVTVVAAFDRYFTTRFSECVTPVLKKEGATDGIVELLDKAGLDLKGALELLHATRPHRKIRNLINTHFSDFTTQKFHVIDDLFRAIGLVDFSDNVQSKARRTQLKVSIEHLIRRRHVIVHAGDLNSHGRLRPLDPYDAMRRAQNVKLFVGKAEEIIICRLSKRRRR